MPCTGNSNAPKTTGKRQRRRRSHRVESLERRVLLNAVSWSSPTGGSWNTPGNWSSGAVPQPGDDVTINQPGNIQITLAGNTSINSLAITGDSLTLSSGTLSVAGGVTNSGTITVDASCQLTIGGNYNQSTGATLSLPGGGSTADPTSNLLANSGFESPAVASNATTPPSNWGPWGTSFLSTQYAHGGVQSLQESGPNSGVLQSFGVSPGGSYTLSVDAMTPPGDPLSGSEAAFLEIIYYTSTGTQITPFAPPNSVAVLTASSGTGGPLVGSVGSVGWNHLSLTTTAPANAASANAILETGAYNGSGAGGGSVYWDDAQFGPVAAGPSELVAGSVTNAGSITIGPTNLVSSNGAFTQTSTGTLELQIGGSPSSGAFGRVLAKGTTSIAGTLKSDLLNGYAPSTTDEFIPMQFASASGSFSSYQLPAGAGYQMDGAVTFTNVLLSAAPTSQPTTTVNATAGLHVLSTNLLGTNLAWWDSALTTSQTVGLAQAVGLTTFRFPGGSSSDDFHFNVSNNFGDSSANTIPQFAQFIQSAVAVAS